MDNAIIGQYHKMQEKHRCPNCKHRKEYNHGNRIYYCCINPEVIDNLDKKFIDLFGNCSVWELDENLEAKQCE